MDNLRVVQGNRPFGVGDVYILLVCILSKQQLSGSVLFMHVQAVMNGRLTMSHHCYASYLIKVDVAGLL